MAQTLAHKLGYDGNVPLVPRGFEREVLHGQQETPLPSASTYGLSAAFRWRSRRARELAGRLGVRQQLDLLKPSGAR